MLENISFFEAMEKCLNVMKEISITKNVFIYDALGEVLAEDIKATRNSPSFNNSAMDGFAFKHSENKKLKIVKTIYAGDKFENFEIKEDECVKIMTGARIPLGVDTVVPIEKCMKITDEYIEIPDIKKGANIRIKGEEFKKGEILLKKGEVLSSNKLALLVSQGIVNVKIFQKPRIAILSTGNELKEPWEIASEDEVYNVNSHSIKLLLKENGFDSDIIGIIPDSLEKSIKFIASLKERYDVIITSGGISFGEKDFMYNAFLKNNLNPLFHGIMVKPGRPTMVGIMDNVVVFALPGNPLSAYLNAFMLVVPSLKKMSGTTKYFPLKIKAINDEEFKVNPKKDHTALGIYKDGKWKVIKKYKYTSGMVSALASSNSITIIKKGREVIKKGEELEVYLI